LRGESPSFAAVRRTAALGIVLAAAVPTAASARPGVPLSLAPFAGAVALDSHLSDYRWNTAVQPAWGLAGYAALGRVTPGIRFWRSSTTQATGIPGDDTALDVALTGFEATAAVRMASYAGFRLLATGSAGLMRISWSPSSLSLDVGLAEPVTADFAPVTEGIFGAGLAVHRGLFAGFDLAVGAERSWFRLDTAHRRGNEIVEDRETFGNWAARVELSRPVLNL
jgi:hypothetical protein